ncbi:MAG: SDR family oxidoreductase [Vampirovibrionales bacterium]
MNPSFSSQDNRPVVCLTGASRGIGEATAQALASHGYRLMLVGRDAHTLATLSDTLYQRYALTPHSVAVCLADLSQPTTVAQQAQHILNETLQAFGRLDTLINNAGVGGKVGLLTELSDDSIATMLTLNLHAPMLLSKHALASFVQQGIEGTIININSIAGKTAFPFWAVYDATKHGLKAFSEALLEEQRSNGIRILSIYPGACNTAIWDSLDLAADESPNKSGMLQPKDVAEAVVFALQQPKHILMNDITLQPTRPVL